MKDSGIGNPPKWAIWLLQRFCKPSYQEMLIGDLFELYESRKKHSGGVVAQFRFVIDVFDLMRPFLIKRSNTQNNTIDMFKNYLKVAYRSFYRQRTYSLINSSGLAIGVVCFLLISLFIMDEMSYDAFHGKSDRTYRVVEHFVSDGVGEHSSSNPFPVGPTMASEYPDQIEAMTRMFNFQSPFLSVANRNLEKSFNESRVFYVDSTFFDVFDFESVAGDVHTALDQPNSVLITKSMAKKYFNEEDPIGQILEFQGEHNYQVTGVMEDAPHNAHFQFDFLVSFSSLKAFYRGQIPNRNWYWNPCWTYVTLSENVNARAVESQFPDFVQKYFFESIRDDITLELQPLEAIHLTSKLDYEIQANSNESNIYIFTAVAIFVLLIAVINFVNLSTARATKRAKEVGIRKALGSAKKQLINQFVFESVLQSILAVLVALGLLALILPQFNGLTEKNIDLITYLTLPNVAALLALTLSVGLLAGFYPAFVMSSYKTTEVIKGGKMGAGGMGFRRLLVVVQFSVSIILIVGTIFAVAQLDFLQNDDLGFDKEAIVMVPVIRTPIAPHFENIKTELLNYQGIKSVTAVEEVLGAKHQVNNYKFEGMDESRPFPRLCVRHDFLETFDIPLLAGRPYEYSHSTDDSLALIVNEAMIKQLGYNTPEEAVGTSFRATRHSDGKIVGVVKDFNFMSKHHAMSPLAIDLWTHPFTFNLFMKYMAVKVDGDNLQTSISHIQNTWTKFIPSRPFEYFFLEDELNNSYQSEIKLSKVTTIFSGLAILVACLGLFGLATFTLEQRTKEIGIRKVLGIQTADIVYLLSKDFILLVIGAFVLAAPAAYWMIDWWLAGFAYRIDLTLWPFFVAGLSTLFVALATVGLHSLKAATINPVKTLKQE